MESLWPDSNSNEDQIDSPAWHADILKTRELRVMEGKESYLDWEVVKKQLRERHFQTDPKVVAELKKA